MALIPKVHRWFAHVQAPVKYDQAALDRTVFLAGLGPVRLRANTPCCGTDEMEPQPMGRLPFFWPGYAPSARLQSFLGNLNQRPNRTVAAVSMVGVALGAAAVTAGALLAAPVPMALGAAALVVSAHHCLKARRQPMPLFNVAREELDDIVEFFDDLFGAQAPPHDPFRENSDNITTNLHEPSSAQAAPDKQEAA